jgi:hypothetical protein
MCKGAQVSELERQIECARLIEESENIEGSKERRRKLQTRDTTESLVYTKTRGHVLV